MRRPRSASQPGLVRFGGTVSVIRASAAQWNFMPAWRQRTKKSVSPPPRKLNLQIEGGIAEPLEYRARDQAIAAAVDDRHRAADSRRRDEMPDGGEARACWRRRNWAAPARRPDRRRRLPRCAPSARASPVRQSRRHRSSGNGSAAGNVASAVSNAALIAWQLPCLGSITHSPGNLPACRNSAATGTLPHPAASFSTMTTAKRRSVR